MEKITIKNSSGLKLSGVLHIPKVKIKSVIIISHGFTANKDRTRFIKATEVFSNSGFAVLRFDFGGCGESDDRPITVKNQVDDLKSAIKYLRKIGYKNIALLGESLGGLTSILAYDDKIRTMILWSSVIKSKFPSIFKGENYLKELKEKKFLIYRKDNKKFIIPQEYLNERLSVNQEKVLSKVRCPVLIIQGTKDDTIPIRYSKEALKYLPKDSELKIIKGASHKLEEKIDEVIQLSVNWLKKYLH